MTLSSLLTWIPSFCMKFVKFLYKSCFVMNLIPIWPQSHKLLFLRLADFCKKMLMSVKFSAITSNFYKFSETTSHCEIAYQIWRVHHFLFKYKNAKKRFSIPHEFDRKTVNLEKKKNNPGFFILFKSKWWPNLSNILIKIKKMFQEMIIKVTLFYFNFLMILANNLYFNESCRQPFSTIIGFTEE